MKYLIYSVEHRAWWKKSKFGYTPLIHEAGLFSLEEATSICTNANFNLTDNTLKSRLKIKIEEMLVPVPEENHLNLLEEVRD